MLAVVISAPHGSVGADGRVDLPSSTMAAFDVFEHYYEVQVEPDGDSQVRVIYTYDAPTVASIDLQAIGTVEAGRIQLSVALEESASPSMEARGTSTTSSAAFVATNTAGGWLDDAATAKVPSGWGPGAANKEGVGTRWTDPANPGNGVRIGGC